MEPAAAAPQRPLCVVLLRHAEKPKKKKEWWLNKKGQRRACYLSWYLRRKGPVAAMLTHMGLREEDKPIAEVIFAMKQARRKDGSFASDRARQTLQPYARRLMKLGRLDNEDFHRWEYKGFQHEFAFEKGREEEMVEYINKYYWGCRVLIAWQHKNLKTVHHQSSPSLAFFSSIFISQILRAFGYQGSFKWKKESYNRTVILTFINGVPVITEHKQEKHITKDRIRTLEKWLTKHE